MQLSAEQKYALAKFYLLEEMTFKTACSLGIGMVALLALRQKQLIGPSLDKKTGRRSTSLWCITDAGRAAWQETPP